MTIVSNGTTTTKTYSYEESTTWKDLLSRFNGKEMEYDAIGNPTTYKDIDLTWTGRQLMAYGTNASYTYNAEGIRKSKTVSGATTTFNLVGSTILSQTKNGQTLVFLYDGNGSLIGFKDKSTNKDYFYLKNLQGDIVKIIDTNKTVVATYEYDDWGKLLTAENSLTSIGQLNPFRYRGYYYDDESGFYYLNSRYYDPETGRFINADEYVSTGIGIAGNNMFAYCNDNPIIYEDSSGQALDTVFDLVSCVMGVAEFIDDPSLINFLGLMGDIADIALPLVSNVGEAIRGLKTVDKIADGVSDVKKGWKVGDDITNLTKAGKDPSWTTVRNRFWKNEAHFNPDGYSEANLDLMKKGRAPLVEYNGKMYPMELHHKVARKDGGTNQYSNLLILTPWDHAAIDPFRHFNPK